MQTSIFLARLLGPVFILVAASVFINDKAFRAIGKEVLGSYALIYLFGVFDLIGGIAIVLVHNLWVADWRVLITLIGWILILRGLFRMLAPDQLKKTGTKMLRNKNMPMISAIIVLVIGAVLSFYGYRI